MEFAKEGKSQMEKVIEHLKGELSRMRVGRATTAMLENIKVNAYGSEMALREVAALAVADAKTLTIQPWDKSLFSEIERGILSSNLGITPMNDGNLIRICMPPMTEERRKEYVKDIKKYSEEAKVSIRNSRRVILENIKELKTSGDISEDGARRVQDEIQKITDHFVAEADKFTEVKSAEVMSM